MVSQTLLFLVSHTVALEQVSLPYQAIHAENLEQLAVQQVSTAWRQRAAGPSGIHLELMIETQ